MSQELVIDFGVIDFVNDTDRGSNINPDFIKNSENLVKLQNAILPEIQELHDAQSDVYSTVNIFEAVGTQLDDIFGELLDLEREQGQTDDSYRLDLLAQATKAARSGEITVMKSLYKNLIGASSVSLFEYQPARFKLEATVAVLPSAVELAKLRQTLSEAKQGGNGMDLSVGIAPIFSLGDSATPQIEDPEGLSGDTFDGGTFSTQITGIILIYTLTTEEGDTFITEEGDTFITEGWF